MSGITRVRNLAIARSTAALLLGIAAVVVIISGPPVPSAQAATNTVVSLTFDDGQASQYSTLPMLSSRGMRGTYYINSALVGSSSYYMPWSQIHDLYNAGNEIGGHTLHHADLTRVSSTEAQREVCDDRTALIGQGFSAVTSFAYPYAAVNNTAEQIVQNCGYTSGRGVGGISSGNVCGDCPYAETIPPGNPNNLQTPEAADSSTTLSQLQSYVTNAESHGGGWVVLVFHGICSNSCTGSNSFSPTIFTAFLDWLQPRSANGTVVRTAGEVITGTPPPPPGPDTTPPMTTITCGGPPCSGWFRTTPVIVTLSATDGGSGVGTTVYTTDGTDPATSPTTMTYANPFPIAGTTTVSFSSTDTAGNIESTRAQQVAIDASPPTANITQPLADAQLRRNSSVTVAATSSDTATGSGTPSGVAQVAFYLDGSTLLATVTSTPYQFTWKIRPNLQGVHTLTAVATDVAGNPATSPQVRVNITR